MSAHGHSDRCSGSRFCGIGKDGGEPRSPPHHHCGVGCFTFLPAALPSKGVLGLKIYATTLAKAAPVMLVWESATGALKAVIEAGRLGWMRTGAASAVATKYLARPDAR